MNDKSKAQMTSNSRSYDVTKTDSWFVNKLLNDHGKQKRDHVQKMCFFVRGANDTGTKIKTMKGTLAALDAWSKLRFTLKNHQIYIQQGSLIRTYHLLFAALDTQTKCEANVKRRKR